MDLRLGTELPHVPAVADELRRDGAAMKLRRRPTGPPGETVYYAGWASHTMPRVPTDPVPESEAIRRQSFYKAVYDDQGRLARLTKFLNGHQDWADEYSYWDNGELHERVMTGSDGSKQ